MNFFDFLRNISLTIAVLIILVFPVSMIASAFLEAAIREQGFQDNIRAARCAKMTEHERENMKGYCK